MISTPAASIATTNPVTQSLSGTVVYVPLGQLGGEIEIASGGKKVDFAIDYENAKIGGVPYAKSGFNGLGLKGKRVRVIFITLKSAGTTENELVDLRTNPP